MDAPGLRLWVTRARPGAEATAARLTALGHAPVASPLLSIRRLRPSLDLTDVGALAFTSRNGVEAFARLTAARDRPVFAVGDATAEAARKAGFSQVRSARGDVNALAALIADAHDRATGSVAVAGAREPAGDLPGALRDAGIQTRAIALYAAVAAPGGRGLAALARGRLDGVLVHSPRAARRLVETTGRDPALDRALAGLRILCISDAAAAPLRALGVTRIAVAPSPDEDALLSLLGKPPLRV